MSVSKKCPRTAFFVQETVTFRQIVPRERLRALQSVSELAVAVAGAVAVVEAVLVAVIQPLVMAGCRVIRE